LSFLVYDWTHEERIRLQTTRHAMHMIFLISAIFMLVAIPPVMIKNKIVISNYLAAVNKEL
jgi:hypothetical protein